MKKVLLVIIILFTVSVLTAHEFWIQPDRFMYEAGETINLRFWVGENFEGENWKGNAQSAALIELRQNKIEDVLTSNLGENEGDSLEISLHDEGTAMFIMQTNNKFISLNAPEFMAYLQDDGLNNAIAYRASHMEIDSSGKENYQRCVKTIIQVGDELSACCLKATKLPLDIIPLKNPYDPELGDSLKFLVKFKGEPLKGLLIKIWHRNNNLTEKTERSTDATGIISIPIEKTGKWMVSTVNMIRTDEIPAQWQSYWGSCTWGYYR